MAMHFDPKYLELCSEKTLQSDNNGFFLQFVYAVIQSVGEKWIKNVFGSLKTDRERIRVIYEDSQIRKQVITFLSNVQEIYRKKSSEVAQNKLKEARNQNELKKSLNLYNQCILKCPQDDAMFPIALIERAEILIKLNEFDFALNDLIMSSKSKLAANLKAQLFYYQAICHKALGENKKSLICLNLAQKLSPRLHHELEDNYKPSEKPKMAIPLRTSQRKLSLQHNTAEGNFTVTNDDIKTGEVLLVEEPTITCLLPEKYGTHCHHCFDRLLAPVGCTNCASVAFCNLQCYQSAATYHNFECKFLDLMIGSGMSVLCLAALRSVTNNSTPLNLCTNAMKRSPKDFLQRTLMAAFLLRCLQKSGYFDTGTSDIVPNEEQYDIGAKILYYLQVLQFNAHEIFETLYTSEHTVAVGRPFNIGVALYPRVSFFNHDCYPSVARYFIGNKIVIRALRPLMKGSKITENYGLSFTHHKYIDRQRVLSSRYWFQCKCTACLDDWFQFGDKITIPRRVRCSSNGCPKLFYDENETQCKNHQTNLKEAFEKLSWCETQYKLARDLVENGEIENAIDVLNESIDLFHRVSAPPHQATHEAESLLRLCYMSFGNTFEGLSRKIQ